MPKISIGDAVIEYTTPEELITARELISELMQRHAPPAEIPDEQLLTRFATEKSRVAALSLLKYLNETPYEERSLTKAMNYVNTTTGVHRSRTTISYFLDRLNKHDVFPIKNGAVAGNAAYVANRQQFLDEIRQFVRKTLETCPTITMKELAQLTTQQLGCTTSEAIVWNLTTKLGYVRGWVYDPTLATLKETERAAKKRAANKKAYTTGG